eukprot:scaffold206023_cov36-Tisochrysis_lutea.AAC.1
MHDFVPFSCPGAPVPNPDVNESRWRRVTRDLASSGSLLHHGTYSFALASSDLIEPSATSPTNIIARGHLDVLAVPIRSRNEKLPCVYCSSGPLRSPMVTAKLSLRIQPSSCWRNGAQSRGAPRGAGSARPSSAAIIASTRALRGDGRDRDREEGHTL